MFGEVSERILSARKQYNEIVHVQQRKIEHINISERSEVIELHGQISSCKAKLQDLQSELDEVVKYNQQVDSFASKWTKEISRAKEECHKLLEKAAYSQTFKPHAEPAQSDTRNIQAIREKLQRFDERMKLQKFYNRVDAIIEDLLTQTAKVRNEFPELKSVMPLGETMRQYNDQVHQQLKRETTTHQARVDAITEELRVLESKLETVHKMDNEIKQLRQQHMELLEVIDEPGITRAITQIVLDIKKKTELLDNYLVSMLDK